MTFSLTLFIHNVLIYNFYFQTEEDVLYELFLNALYTICTLKTEEDVLYELFLNPVYTMCTLRRRECNKGWIN